MYSSTLSLTSALDGAWVVNATLRRFRPGKDPVAIVHEAGWTPGRVWTAAENLAPTGIRFPDRNSYKIRIYLLKPSGNFTYDQV
jgi:hypothetical protein